MSSFLSALQGQSVTIILLICSIVGEGSILVYRMDKLEEKATRQSNQMERLAEDISDMKIAFAELKAHHMRNEGSAKDYKL